MPNIIDRYKKNLKDRLLPADRVVEEMDREDQVEMEQPQPSAAATSSGMTPETLEMYKRLMGPVERSPEEDAMLQRETGMSPETARMYEDLMQQDPRTGQPIAPRFQKLRGIINGQR